MALSCITSYKFPINSIMVLKYRAKKFQYVKANCFQAILI